MRENCQITLNKLQSMVSNKPIMLVLDKTLDWIEANPNHCVDENLTFILDLVVLLKYEKDYTFELGYKRFYDVRVELEKGVFVPQYDTENLVEEVLDIVGKNDDIEDIMEIGFGTGAITIALAKILSDRNFFAIDTNQKALRLAKNNAKRNDVNRNTTFVIQDIFKYKTTKTFDLIVSNPPYIEAKDSNVTGWVKDNQPVDAIYSSNKGLNHIESIVNFSEKTLNEEGFLIFEFGFNQKDLIEEKIIDHEVWDYQFKKDLSGNWRYVVLRRKW